MNSWKQIMAATYAELDIFENWTHERHIKRLKR